MLDQAVIVRPRRPTAAMTTPRGSIITPPPSMAHALAQFTATGLIAMLVLTAVGTIMLRRTGVEEALHEARLVTQVQAQAIAPYLTDAVMVGDPQALARLDHAVRSMVVNGRVQRVKLWSGDGRVVYADDQRLIGRHFRLGDGERQTLTTGIPTSDLSDLSAPENTLDPARRPLLEVYVRASTPTGTPVLFETYQTYDSVRATSDRIWLDLAPTLGATLLVLQLLQWPLAWRLTRRLQQHHRERDALQRNAIEASDAERQRIAGDLHDGVVQTLTGVSYTLAAVAIDTSAAPGVIGGSLWSTIATAADLTRRSIVELRTLLVDIYPPSLRESGLKAALSDLVVPLAGRGLIARLSVPDGLELASEVEELLYRTAQEAVRNVLTHARADHVDIRLTVRPDSVVLDVEDDGCGFEHTTQADLGSHFGLRLLHRMASRLAGRLWLESVPGLGTSLHLQVPLS